MNNNGKPPLPKKLPKSVSELFPSPWLYCDDLNGRTVTVEIKGISFDWFAKNPRNPNGEQELKGILDFGRSKQMILNKTQAQEIEDVMGSEDFMNWIGRRVTLAPGRSHNNKPTIKILPPPAPKAELKPETQPDQPDDQPTEEDFLNV